MKFMVAIYKDRICPVFISRTLHLYEKNISLDKIPYFLNMVFD
jgi:hypothetical protein